MVSIPNIMPRTLQELSHLVFTTILWKINYNYLYFTYEEYIIIIYIWHMSKWNLRKSNSLAWITDAGTWDQVSYCWTVAFNHYSILYFQHGLHPWVRSPGIGNGNLLQYSCLENSMDRGAWRALVHKVTKSWTRLKRLNVHAERWAG